MKIATYLSDGNDRVGVVVDEQVYDLAVCLKASGQENSIAPSTLAFLGAGEAAIESANAAIDWAKSSGDEGLVQPLSAVKLRAPVPCPGKMLCLAG